MTAPRPAATDRADLDLVIVTGLSGGGRSTVARALENVGYYVVDNLPQALVVTMAELAYESGGPTHRTALVLDVRSHAFTGVGAIAPGAGRSEAAGTPGPGGSDTAPRAPDGVVDAVGDLRERGFRPRVLFLDATDDVLVQRFENVRRSHPLQGDGRLADGIAAERVLLRDVRAWADMVVDTSQLNVNQLRSKIESLFAAAPLALRVTVVSFGFKYGLPADADFVADLRWLPNPHWVPELRTRTGRDASVAEYVLAQPGAVGFLERYAGLLRDVADGFEREGKRYVTVALGCTGGKHRSVAMSEALAVRLRERSIAAEADHRDLGRE